MIEDQILSELEALKSDADVYGRSYALTDAWTARGLGLEAVAPILRFMESHPDIGYGSPGPLVHFVERFDGHRYGGLLLESFSRKPTWHTAWMLNRLINGESDASSRSMYVRAMKGALAHPLADGDTVEQIRRFLARL